MVADAYYDKVSLLLPMSGSNNGTTFTDYSYIQKTVTVAGNAVTSTAQFKYYDSSGYFDGAGDYLQLATSTDVQLGSNDFTIEAWVRTTTTASVQAIVDRRSSLSARGLSIFIDTAGGAKFWFAVGDISTTAWEVSLSSSAINANQWYHVAFVRSGNNYTGYVDGVSVGTTTWSGTPADDTATWLTGAAYTPTAYFNGYMQDLRITKGYARYTGTFTPPTKLVGTLSGTVKDDANANAARSVVALLRDFPTLRLPYTTTSAGDGTWSLTVPVNNYVLMCLDDTAGTTYNDLIYGRVTPV